MFRRGAFERGGTGGGVTLSLKIVQPTSWRLAGSASPARFEKRAARIGCRREQLAAEAYRPFQFGGRFSANARGPSTKSSLRERVRTES